MEYRSFLSKKNKEELIKIILNLKRGTKVLQTCFQQKVAFKMRYDGCKYAGLVSQKDERTIEDLLKLAFLNSGLAKENVQITFAGRTDKKVSASGMVFTAIVSSLHEREAQKDLGLPDSIVASSETHEKPSKDADFNYDTILNTHLPPDMRILGWRPVPIDFCARKSCRLRCYRYYFISRGLDIVKMEQACCIIQGGKNFRNLSKAPTKKELMKIPDIKKHFYRPISGLHIEERIDHCIVQISSKSFLHNMVRKIFWLLKEVGRGAKDLGFVKDVFGSEIIKCGTERPEFLVFSEAKYEPGLEFYCSEQHYTAADRHFIEGLVQQDIFYGFYRYSS